MFDDLKNSSTPTSIGETTKTEDIFAGVENHLPDKAVKPVETPAIAPNAVANESIPNNKKYFIIGVLILVIILFVAGGWYVFANYSKFFDNKKVIPPVTDSFEELNKEIQNSLADDKAIVSTTTTGDLISASSTIDSAATSLESSSTAAVSASDNGSTTPINNSGIDSDGDGLTDDEEKNLNTNLNSSDSDSDGLFDYEEVKTYLTDPNKTDTDGDGFTDGQEVKGGYNPAGPGKLFDTNAPAENIKK